MKTGSVAHTTADTLQSLAPAALDYEVFAVDLA
jgi:hypothetical protein